MSRRFVYIVEGRCNAMEVVEGPDDTREELFEALVNQYQGLLLKMCYVWLCDFDQARDAVQETFLKAYRSREILNHADSEKAWLLTVARNTCRDMKRSAWWRHTDRRLTPDDLPEAAAPAAQRDLDLTAAILALPDKLKDVILLYYYENLSVTEIAQILNIAQPSVSNRLTRARLRLRAILEKGEEA